MADKIIDKVKSEAQERAKKKVYASEPKSDSYKYWTHAKTHEAEVKAKNSKAINAMIAAKKKQK